MQFRLRTLLIVLALGPPVLAQERSDPGEAIYGEWEIVEMIYRGKVQDFKGNPAGWYVFSPGGVIRIFGDEIRERVLGDKVTRKWRTFGCSIRDCEIDIVNTPPLGKGELTKGLYDLKDGKLRLIYPNDGGERPTDFDEAFKNPRLTLYVLKKVK